MASNVSRGVRERVERLIREELRLENPERIVASLALGEDQLPDTRERVAKALHELKIARINASTVRIRAQREAEE